VFVGRRSLPLPNRALQFPPLVYCGLISYSLYLWHWPIIVLGQYYLVRDFGLFEVVCALALMLALASASWWFVERPFRDIKMPIIRVRWVVAISVATLGLSAAVLILSHGLPWRLNQQAAAINEAVDSHYRCPVSGYLVFGESRACVMNLPTRN